MIRKILTMIMLLALVAIAAFLIARGWYNSAIYGKNTKDVKNIEVVVLEGESTSSVAKKLEDVKLIKSSLALKVYLKLSKTTPVIRPGTYSISSDTSAVDILALLAKGQSKPSAWVTVKEGLRDEQIADILEKGLKDSTAFKKKEFLDIAKNPDKYEFSPDIQAFLNKYKPKGKPLLGFLYPDTYRFDLDQDAKQVTETLISNFITKVNEAMNLDKLKLKQSNITTLYQAMTLGSIVEKEAASWDDRAMIAGVFHNRLSDNYPLQTDVSINFITQKDEAIVTIADTKIDSPYNTYLHTGLPPTPLDNPRVDSIKAAFYPKITSYYFFFHSKDDKTLYSETFEEHNQKVLQYGGQN